MLIFSCIYFFFGGIIGSLVYHIMMGAFPEHTPEDEMKTYSEMPFFAKIAIAILFAALWPIMIIIGWYGHLTGKLGSK